jgi:prepilin-type N-terminal cleavage/methylation domain-containing protein
VVLRKGFTIIEIIVSVVIIAIVTLTLAKVNRQNTNMVDYISTRNKYELSNTLFLTKEATKYNKSEKDAYTLLSKMGIKNTDVRMYLKKIKRKIYTQNAIPVDKMIVPVNLNAIMLKSEFSTRYYRFEP